ncbi:MAG: DUF6285 domain-containing protein [Thermaurantiacus sp.]
MGHPTALELLEAVRLFLKEAESALEGRQAFHAKVAANVLSIVRREMQQAPETAEAAALADFGGASAVCEGLRNGRLQPEDPALLNAMRTAVLVRLAVDNPRYPTFVRLGGGVSGAADVMRG